MVSKVQKGQSTAEYDGFRMQELLRCAMSPAYFIKTYVKIQHPMKGMIPFSLYPYQERMLETMQHNRHTIVLSARQTGKSQTSAAFLLWYALFNEDKTILIASNKNSNALEMISRIRYMYETIPNWLKPGITADGWNKLSVGFDNKSRIISTATSESSGRGLSISLLFCDELAFVNQSIQQEFWKSMQPTLSTGGACIISSTPNGEGDLFSEIWHGAEMGVNGYAPIFVRWDEPPGRDENFKNTTIAQLGEIAWRQEFECEFLTSESLLIDTLFLQNLKQKLIDTKPIKESSGVLWYEEVSKDVTYIMGVDPSTGSGKDFSVIQLFEFPTLRQIAQFRSNKVSSPQLYLTMKNILREIDQKESRCYFSVENNGVGEGVIALYQNDENMPESAQFISEEGKNRLGMATSVRSKMKACLNFKSLLQSRKMTIKSILLHTELTKYAVGKGAYEALPGATDDCVAAVLIVVRILNEISSYEQAAFDALFTYTEQSEDYNNPDDEQFEEPLAMII